MINRQKLFELKRSLSDCIREIDEILILQEFTDIKELEERLKSCEHNIFMRLKDTYYITGNLIDDLTEENTVKLHNF